MIGWRDARQVHGPVSTVRSSVNPLGKPKLHHYVPQFHLRRFTDERGRLWAWDKSNDRTFATSPGSIAAETQFYRLTQYEADGHDPLTLEKQLSHMEGEVSTITDQWLGWLRDMKPMDRVPIPNINRWIVARYLAVQMLRTLDARELLAAFIEDERGSPIDDQEARELHTELIWDPKIVEHFRRRFTRSIWLFARNDTPTPFVTSDNPISFRTSDNRQWRRSPALAPDTYLVFAMSPEIVLYCHPRSGPFRNAVRFADCLSPIALTDEMVESENTGQAFMGSRFILSKRNMFDAERDFARTIGTDIYAPS